MKRYAIYAAPPGPLSEAAANWLGWDAIEGAERPCPGDFPFDWAAVTEAPRKYGFHGTLKAPFRLAEGRTEAELRDEMDRFGSGTAPVPLDGLQLSALAGFVALVPVGDTAALDELAGNVVRSFDAFRAPPTEAEVARRGLDKLSPRQQEQFWSWGYPFVFEDFRFHMTLSGKLDDAARAPVTDALTRLVVPHVPAPFVIGDLCLFGEGQDGRFRILHRSALSG